MFLAQPEQRQKVLTGFFLSFVRRHRRCRGKSFCFSIRWSCFDKRSPETVVGLQDVHDRPHRRREHLVHSEHGAVASGLVVSGDAGVLDAQVLQNTHFLNSEEPDCTPDKSPAYKSWKMSPDWSNQYTLKNKGTVKVLLFLFFKVHISQMYL